MAPSPQPPPDSGTRSDNLGPALVAISWVFALLSTCVVASRYYVRLRVVKRFRIDDWLILATLILAICDSIFCTVAVSFGLGRHIQFLSDMQIMMSTKYIYLCEFFSIMSPGIGRISYAFLLLELVPPNKIRRRFLWGIICAQFVVDVGTVIISFSQCQPIQGFWDKTIDANCWDPVVQEYTGFFQGSVCSLVDLLLALFPMSLFWNLKMKLTAKISLSVLMGLGVFAMVCSIIKTIELRAIANTSDPTYAMAVLAIWWTLEAYMVLIAASLPTLRPLMGSTQASRSQAATGSKSYGLSSFRNPRGNGTESATGGPFVKLDGQTLHRPSDEETLAREADEKSEGGKSVIDTNGSSNESAEVIPGTITKQTSMSVKYERTPAPSTQQPGNGTYGNAADYSWLRVGNERD